MGCQSSSDATQCKEINHRFSIHLLKPSKTTTPDNPESNGQSPVKGFAESSIDRSISEYQEFIQTFPAFNCPLDGLGNQEDQVGYYEQKVELWYRFSRQKGTVKGNPYDALSLCYTMKKDVSEGLIWYQKMLIKNPHTYQLQFGLGNLYYKLSDYDNAEQCYRKCIDLNPGFSKAYQTIANIYCYKKFDNGIARQWAQFALKINPYNQFANLIKALTEQDVQIRINELIKIRELFPYYARICNALGSAFFENNHIEEAIQWYIKGFEINPYYYAVCCGLGMAYNFKGDTQSAIKWSSKSMDLNPTHHEPYNSLGDAHNTNGDQIEAQKWYRKCIEVNPKMDVAYYELALIYKSNRKFEEAEQLLKTCIELNPSNCHFYIQLTKIQIEVDKKQEGILILTNSLQHDQQNYEILMLLGDLHLETCDYLKAEQIYQFILTFKKGDQTAKQKLGLIMQSKEQRQLKTESQTIPLL